MRDDTKNGCVADYTLREEAAFCGVVVNWRKVLFPGQNVASARRVTWITRKRSFSSIEKKTNMIAGISTVKARQFRQSLQLSSVQGQ